MQPKKHNLIAPSTYQEKLCKIFSDEVYITNKDMYASRNQDNEGKVKADIYMGKLAEFAVFNYLWSLGKEVSAPDIMIYQAKNKSYDADLYINSQAPLHVKSCMEISGYSNSWVFQPNDPLVSNPNEDETIALVVVNNSGRFYCYIVKATEMISMYRDPRKATLNKKVLYEEDFI
jgi:hypothetical protein